MELLQKKGFKVVACVTGDPILAHWARSQDIESVTWNGELGLAQKLAHIDYGLLLSVGNLYRLSPQVLQLKNALAINIHDGPMHDYLGFNTPAWALMNSQTQHQVCWHEIEPELYQGRILAQQYIEIEPDETAMTLNAKCFTAALSSLEYILEGLSQNGVALLEAPKPNLKQVQYFKHSDRPGHLGFLTPTDSSEVSLALVRALDTGHYDNPLCLAKVQISQTLYHVTHAERLADVLHSQQAELGSIVDIKANTIHVKWSDAVLALTLAAVSVLQQEIALTDSLKNTKLSIFDSTQLQVLSQHFGVHEAWWLAQLRRFSALSLPYVDGQLVARGATQSQAIDVGKSFIQRLALTTAFMARLCDEPLFAIPIVFDRAFAGPASVCDLADDFAAPRHAWCFQFDWALTLDQQMPQFQSHWQDLMSAGAFSCDLVKRHADLAQWQASVDQPYCLFISDESDHDLKTRLACFADYAWVIVAAPQSQTLRVVSHGGLIKPLQAIANEVSFFIEQAQTSSLVLGDVPMVTPVEQALLQDWSVGSSQNVDQLLFDRLASSFASFGEKTAVYHRHQTCTFNALQQQILQVVAGLKEAGTKPGEFVGVMMPRCLELLPCLLGVMSYGAACVPMDPLYPHERLEYVIDNSGLKVILCDQPLASLSTQAQQIPWSNLAALSPATEHVPAVVAADLAYMLYTSGSSGKPKGVMVEHGNLANFFLAMDQKVDLTEDSVWLAVTSISFDISLLELLWTLTRGVAIVLYDGQDLQTATESKADQSSEPQAILTATPKASESRLDFGLFFWNISNEHDQPGPHQYELLLKAAEFGDQNGFSSVWTPERHFGDFGGLYPNPAITSAAVAARTKNIHVRAGSCVFPLHHPVRIAEDWAIIDNISNGRVGLAAAPGWMPDDFVIMPENHKNAKTVLLKNVEIVKKLWRGDPVQMDGPNGVVDVRTLPRPVQKELPIWITTGGNPDNFRQAGEMGAYLLTHLLGQTVEELAPKIKIYKDAWSDAGHAGEGYVTVMLHTFVGTTVEHARQVVFEPMKNYLKTALFLVKAAAWDWPLFKKLSDNQSQNLDEFFENISDEDLDALLSFAFDRYFKTSGLFGDKATCVAFADTLYAIGVGEIGCLVDFGIDTATVLDNLPLLKAVLDETNRADRKVAMSTSGNIQEMAQFGVAALMERHNVTHLQVTPSMARLFLSDPSIAAAMAQLKTMLVGGEALPLDLAKTLKGIIQGSLLNMYGPTETTIWSSVDIMSESPHSISLGQSVVNTQISIVDKQRQPLPIGAIGELFIGGAGVVRGYWQREDLTTEKFLTGYPAYSSATKVYATGDLARYLPDGRLMFLGRNDFQVKVRGYRIELEEIETLLLRQKGIAEAIVHPVVYSGAEPRLVGYYTLKSSESTIDSQAYSQVLKQALAAQLPAFMVPNVFVRLQAFPLTPNAKIDRKALPLPNVSQTSLEAEVDVGNASDLELKVLDIWRDILGTHAFGLEDNFFDHGGHSLLVVDVMTRVRPLFEKQIKLIDLFRHPQVRALVEYLADDSTNADSAMIESAQSRAAARRAARRR